MRSLSRRTVLHGALAAGAAAWSGLEIPGTNSRSAWARPQRDKLPVAGVVTEYRDNSHADVLLGKILAGWDQQGGPGPDLRLASLYVDQTPANDWSRMLAEKHGFRLAKSIDEALTLGGSRLAVAGVLSIGEHGVYPETPDTKQQMYPRRRFFDEIVATFDRTRQVVPVFNDKHLAYAWRDARHMVETARARGFPLMAGSSLPVCWRQPEQTLPTGAVVEEMFALGYGPLEGYGFHAVEMLQCQMERRRGGETGLKAVEVVQGEAIWKAAAAGRWSRSLLDAALAAVPVYRPGKIEEILNPDASWYLLEYRDGVKAAVGMANGATADFAVATRIAGQPQPQVTWFMTQEDEPFAHFGYQLRGIEHMIHTWQPAWPVERTLMSTGILDAAMHSLARPGTRIETPEMDVRYSAADWPFADGKPAKA